MVATWTEAGYKYVDWKFERDTSKKSLLENYCTFLINKMNDYPGVFDNDVEVQTFMSGVRDTQSVWLPANPSATDDVYAAKHLEVEKLLGTVLPKFQAMAKK